jgi:malate dehydrogenase (oxaloacetate-decarboxylating)
MEALALKGHIMSSNKDGNNKQKGSAGFSITVKLTLKNQPGGLAQAVQVIAAKEGSLGEVLLLESNFINTHRAITISCRNEEHAKEIVNALNEVPNITVEGWQDDTLSIHLGGKIEVNPRVKVDNNDDLARVYTPGVARVCKAIVADPDKVYDYTGKRNAVAIISDGSAVLGLGNIGATASLPVMEGKAILFKKFGQVDAYPIVLGTQDTEEIISTIKAISPGFGGINLEDIAAPRCFEIEERLIKELDIPVFHDDQHGTAVVVLAGLINALRVVKKAKENVRVVINGFGAGGIAIARLLLDAGIRNLIACDSVGTIYRGRTKGMNAAKENMALVTNTDNIEGTLADAIKNADVFIGVSQPNVLTRQMVESMNANAIVFALANPDPEIMPHLIQDIVGVIATGRSDYGNQINNALCFPGLFRGILDARARIITSSMKIAAAYAIAACVSPTQLSADYIIPGCLNNEVSRRVADAVIQTTMSELQQKS